MNSIQVITRDFHETEQAGASLAASLRPGDVLLLRGDLGAGKTVFARGIARGLGIVGPVTSPTFTLLHSYEGRVPLHHFDLYRLGGAEDFFQSGLEEYLGGQAISVVEWPECCEEAMPACHLEIRISRPESDVERMLALTPMGGFREVSI